MNINNYNKREQYKTEIVQIIYDKLYKKNNKKAA